jgi:hypothetical protein
VGNSLTFRKAFVRTTNRFEPRQKSPNCERSKTAFRDQLQERVESVF